MEMKVFKETFSNNALPLKGGVNRKERFLLVIFKSALTSREEDCLPPVPVVMYTATKDVKNQRSEKWRRVE